MTQLLYYIIKLRIIVENVEAHSGTRFETSHEDNNTKLKLYSQAFSLIQVPVSHSNTEQQSCSAHTYLRHLF